MELRFFKQNNCWYADVPNHTLAENEMVCGSDTLLETISQLLLQGRLEVNIEFAQECENPLIQLDRCAHDDAGAHYTLSGELPMRHNACGEKIWICNVTHDVFGEHPQQIFIKSIS